MVVAQSWGWQEDKWMRYRRCLLSEMRTTDVAAMSAGKVANALGSNLHHVKPSYNIVLSKTNVKDLPPTHRPVRAFYITMEARVFTIMRSYMNCCIDGRQLADSAANTGCSKAKGKGSSISTPSKSNAGHIARVV